MALTGSSNTASPDIGERLHGLDAVRGYALLLGVVFHATMSFLPPPQVWPIRDLATTPVLGAVFFVAHIFRMTTFFIIAGFFARMMVERRGVGGFIRDRLKRIALPLVVAWPFMIAGIIGAALLGAHLAHVRPAPPPPNPLPLGFPLTHLWFLYVLLIFYALALAARGLVARMDRNGRLVTIADRLMRLVVGSAAGPFFTALLPALALYGYSYWLPWFGTPAPDMSLLPNFAAMTEYGLAFGFGWLLNRQAGLMETWRRRWPLNLAVAVALTAGLLGWLGLAPVVKPPGPGPERAGLALAYALAMWSWTFAVIGLALRFLSDHSPVRRYIADSSYWVYLIHLPLVMTLQALVSRLAWPWEVKFAIVLGVGFPLMFGSYQLFVRRTLIGAVLNGRRAPPPERAAPALQPEAAR